MNSALVHDGDDSNADLVLGVRVIEDEVTLFRTTSRLFVVETGGPKEQMERARPSLDWMLASTRVRCNTFVSPVLASRTCNRW